jgi:hypothetical protein
LSLIYQCQEVTGLDWFWWTVLPRGRGLRHLARRYAAANRRSGSITPGEIVFCPPDSREYFTVTSANGDYEAFNPGHIPGL